MLTLFPLFYLPKEYFVLLKLRLNIFMNVCIFHLKVRKRHRSIHYLVNKMYLLIHISLTFCQKKFKIKKKQYNFCCVKKSMNVCLFFTCLLPRFGKSPRSSDEKDVK